ncbi:MAG TPA: hypothetical protein VKA64_07335 [Gammaproteobacteria bacterium]|nr:hypothetical protein [Gammaproteobacteria bacterium]
MSEDRSRERRAHEAGIAGLPAKWRVPVQLISTFGLAVFLVLYYLFVIRPEDVARFEAMRQTIDELKQVVQADAAFLKNEQAERLERLYIDAVVPEVVEILRQDKVREAAIGEIDRRLILKTDRLRGFVRENGRTVTEQLRARLRPAHPGDRDVAKILVDAAAENEPASADYPAFARDLLRDVLQGRRMAK